jgi:DNA-binding NarL/FixJ family response regulator
VRPTGGTVIDGQVIDRLDTTLDSPPGTPPDDRADGLSTREDEVARVVATGASNLPQ